MLYIHKKMHKIIKKTDRITHSVNHNYWDHSRNI